MLKRKVKFCSFSDKSIVLWKASTHIGSGVFILDPSSCEVFNVKNWEVLFCKFLLSELSWHTFKHKFLYIMSVSVYICINYVQCL